MLAAIAAIGFTAHPYDRERAQEVLARERRDRLLRFLVAGALGMQVMTLAVALYAGAFSGMEEEFTADFFRWTSLLLTAPVLLYSARPFFAGASNLAHARVGMDVPVALGLTLAYFGSVWATIADRGEVYFDSVVMFVFLLLGARVLELVARERAVREESVVRSVPATARRLGTEDASGTESIVATVELAIGDRVRILPGESVPADGLIEEGHSSLDEALLTGESVPVARAAGDRVIGGAVNVEPAGRAGHGGRRGHGASGPAGAHDEQALAAETEDIASRRPHRAVVRAPHSGARGGRRPLLGLGQPERVLPTVIAVLVVSCPCALSLATPVALAAASGAGAARLLATRGHAIETLGRADLFVFDKTGTLTTGKLPVVRSYRRRRGAPPRSWRPPRRSSAAPSIRLPGPSRRRARRRPVRRSPPRPWKRRRRPPERARPRADRDARRRADGPRVTRLASPTSWVSPCRRSLPSSPPANVRWSSSRASWGCAGDPAG